QVVRVQRWVVSPAWPELVLETSVGHDVAGIPQDGVRHLVRWHEHHLATARNQPVSGRNHFAELVHGGVQRIGVVDARRLEQLDEDFLRFHPRLPAWHQNPARWSGKLYRMTNSMKRHE